MNTELWVTIPGGPVTLEAGGYLVEPTRFHVEPFVITRCPVTNALYTGFVEAGGYMRRAWWTDAGWAVRDKENWTGPRFWDSRDWTQPDHPVVGVSWYEALAFCRWWSVESGLDITLPTEQQWQRAAQGNDGRDYPWGNDQPAPKHCNWNRLVDETTPVTHYPAGASPYGVLDMSGNVWEWCLTGWDSGTTTPANGEARLLRGGSWSSDSPLSLRAAHRSPKDPNTRLSPGYRHHVTVGFRCVYPD